jgi:TatD DNase family protein
MLFDTHTHYDEERFDADRDETIRRAHDEGVCRMVNVSNCMETAGISLRLSGEYEFIYAAVGLHPYYADEMNDVNISILREYAKSKKVVAVGEIGLDYFHMPHSKQMQKECFTRQMELAAELNLPVMIHDREAHQDVFDLMVRYRARDVGGVMHSYSGSVEMARRYLDLGFYLSVAGPITYLNARKILEVVKYAPMDRILIETDCPDLSPEPFRGTRNDSSRLKLIAAKIAVVKGLSFDAVSAATTENAKQLLRMPEWNEPQGNAFPIPACMPDSCIHG